MQLTFPPVYRENETFLKISLDDKIVARYTRTLKSQRFLRNLKISQEITLHPLNNTNAYILFFFSKLAFMIKRNSVTKKFYTSNLQYISISLTAPVRNASEFTLKYLPNRQFTTDPLSKRYAGRKGTSTHIK